MNILFCLSGSIACFKSAQVISQLVQAGHKVKTAATKGALEFIGEATLEGLTGERVFSDLFSPGQMMDHIDLAKWADLNLVCPASASIIAELTHGMAQSTVGALFLASDFKNKPWLVAPAMNQQMWAHPAVQNNLNTLTSWGVTVLTPGTGHQACGDVGPGRMMEPQDILSHIKEMR